MVAFHVASVTTDVIDFFNDYLGMNLRPLFLQYLYRWQLPVLEYRFAGDAVEYRWRADVPEFEMPIQVRSGGEMHFIRPTTTSWKSEPLPPGGSADWVVATDLFYVGTEEVAPE